MNLSDFKNISAISILHAYGKIKSKMNILSDNINELILDFILFDELHLLYISHNNMRYIRNSFRRRTNSIPWIINIVVKDPIGCSDETYYYGPKDISYLVLNIGDYDLYSSNLPLLNETLLQLSSFNKVRDRIGNEMILRDKDKCIRTILMTGVGGKIPLLSYIPEVLKIPLSILKTGNKRYASIKGNIRYDIGNITYCNSNVIDKIYFSSLRLKYQKPKIF